MKCQHINKALDKINNLIGRMNNTDSALYEKKGPFIKEEDIKTHLDDMGGYWKARTTWGYTYTYKSIRQNAVYDNLSDIFDELNSCNCRSELDRKYNELEDRFNDLRDDFKGKEAELEEEMRQRKRDKEEHHSEKLRWTRTEGEIKTAKARIEERLESSSSQTIELRRRLKDSESQVLRIENKLDEKNVKIQTLTGKLADLRIEINNKENELESKIKEKENELRQKEEEIKRSQGQAENSQEELLNEKIRSEKGNLELFATELKINLEQIHGLSRYHERLFQARKTRNQANIATHEDNVEKIKQALLENKISIVNVQEICRKCERMAELRWELEQMQQPNPSNSSNNKKDWTNINSNFTPELVQEWTNRGFTYEQCQEWININQPLQQNQAIKEPAYYAWLRDVKKVSAEWVLNQGNERALSLEFFRWYQEQQQQQYQNQQEQTTNN